MLAERLADKLTELSDSVHQAMIDTINIPSDDLFQILTAHQHGRLRYDPDYLGVHRDDDIVFVSITLRSGRSIEQKRALYRRVTELISERVGVQPRNVLIALTENESSDWSFGEGHAQMLN